jgi:hypothetical protein
MSSTPISMLYSTAPSAAEESAQSDFPHSLLEFCTKRRLNDPLPWCPVLKVLRTLGAPWTDGRPTPPLFGTLVFRDHLCTLAHLVQPRYQVNEQHLIAADGEAINYLQSLVRLV